MKLEFVAEVSRKQVKKIVKESRVKYVATPSFFPMGTKYIFENISIKKAFDLGFKIGQITSL